MTLPRIPPERRRGERTFWAEFEQALPRILGALLDAVSCALREVDGVKLDEAPRMADFAEWIVAAEPALPWEPGDFMRSYAVNRESSVEIVLEGSPISEPLRELSISGFEGTASELLAALGDRVEERDIKRREWPKAPRGLSAALRKLAPALRQTGVEVEFYPPAGHESSLSARLGVYFSPHASVRVAI